MLMAAAVALDAQKAVLQQPALQVVVEFLADKLRQVATRSFDFLNKSRVVLGDNGIERRLFRPVAVVGRSGGNRGWSGHWT